MAAAERERAPDAGRARRRGCNSESSLQTFAVLTLSCQGTQAYEEVLSHKTVSGEDNKKEGKGSEKEAKTL